MAERANSRALLRQDFNSSRCSGCADSAALERIAENLAQDAAMTSKMVVKIKRLRDSLAINHVSMAPASVSP